jgi:ABC-type phosphate transport system substrate-binding protein
MRKTVTTALVALLLLASIAAAEERIQMGGTSGMIPIMQEMAKAYEATHPAERVEVLTGSLDSTGGISGWSGASS